MKKIVLKALKKSSYLANVCCYLCLQNTTCTWIIHQPKYAKRFKEVKKDIDNIILV